MQIVGCLFSTADCLFSNRNLRFLALFGSLLFLISVAGCKKSDGKVSVHGHVSYRGEALETCFAKFFS